MRIKGLIRRGVLIVYVPVAVVWAVVFYARHRRFIRRHDVVFPFWIWTFGHQLIGWELMRRLFHSSRVLVIEFPHPRTNPFVGEWYRREGLAVLRWRPLGSWRIDLRGSIDAAVLRAILQWDAWSRGATMFHFIHDLYRIGRPVSDLLEGDFGGSGLRPGSNLTAFMRRLKEPHPCPRFPEETETAIVAAIRRRHPDFNGRFVTVHLRGHRGNDPSEVIREVSDPTRYRSAVERITSQGLWVLIGGAIDRNAFAGLPRVIVCDDIDYEAAAVNLYALSRCLFFIGNQCGTHVLPNIMGRPCLLVDAMPYNLGTFHERDLVMFKEIHARGGRRLSLEEIYADETAFGHDLEAKGLVLIENHPDDIRAAVDEMLAIVEERFHPTDEQRRLIDRFKALLKPTMSIHHAGNRPPIAFLQKCLRPLTAQTSASSIPVTASS